jgi:signal transduction histidine kinase
MEKIQILIVDDNKNNLVTLRTLIDEHLEVDVLEAQSGITALDILMNGNIDLAILDVQMPDIDGFQLTELIRSRKKTAHIPIILLTAAYISDKFKQRGFELGVEDYITKPINDAALIGRLKAYLRPLTKEREFAQELEKKIKERTEQLEKLNRQLVYEIEEKKKIEQELIVARDLAEKGAIEKSQFLSTMSHEIRTPLNAVIGMAYLLIQENPREDQLENLRILKFSADNLLVLINDILDFGKIEAGKISFEDLDFNLKNLFSNIRQSFMPLAEEKGIEIIIKNDPALPEMVIGDPVRLSQILTNLLSNAVKFTQKGFVTAETLVKKTDNDSLTVEFIISDTGIGIASEMVERIFEQFIQARSDTTRKYGGTGLGLAITKRLLELQGSSIRLESEVGKGSTFCFELVFKKSRHIEQNKRDITNTEDFKSLKGIKILMAEDNKVNQLIALKFLNNWDIEVDVAENGLVALDKLKNNKYDLILMDIQMPEMDGYEATTEIRKLEGQYGKIPVLALTASAMADIQNKISAVGMTDFVTKPFNPSDLYRKIVKALSAH